MHLRSLHREEYPLEEMQGQKSLEKKSASQSTPVATKDSLLEPTPRVSGNKRKSSIKKTISDYYPAVKSASARRRLEYRKPENAKEGGSGVGKIRRANSSPSAMQILTRSASRKRCVK